MLQFVLFYQPKCPTAALKETVSTNEYDVWGGYIGKTPFLSQPSQFFYKHKWKGNWLNQELVESQLEENIFHRYIEFFLRYVPFFKQKIREGQINCIARLSVQVQTSL